MSACSSSLSSVSIPFPLLRNDYYVAVPSYNRANTLQKATLHVLQQHSIPTTKVFIFVGNEEQKQLYEKQLKSEWHSRLFVAKVGMKNVRNFITSFFAEGQRIFYMDDDIFKVEQIEWDKTLFESKGGTRKEHGNVAKPLESLDLFIKKGFQECDSKKRRLFGVNPVGNAFFCVPNADCDRSIKDGFYFTVGCFYGAINDKVVNCVHVDNKEDYERSMRYYLCDGGVIRFQGITVETNYFTEPGGMQSGGQRSWQLIEDQTKFLIRNYKDLMHLNAKRKRKDKETKKPLAEVTLKDKRLSKVFGAAAAVILQNVRDFSPSAADKEEQEKEGKEEEQRDKKEEGEELQLHKKKTVHKVK